MEYEVRLITGGFRICDRYDVWQARIVCGRVYDVRVRNGGGVWGLGGVM